MDGPVDNLVLAFATHLEAVAASGCSPATVNLYDGRYKAFLSYLKASGFAPPFTLDLLNATHARRAGLWIKEQSHGHRGGEHSMRMLVCVLKIGSAWLADEGYLEDEIDPLARVRRPRATSGAQLPFTQADVRSLIGAAMYLPTGARDVAMIHLLLDTGMRAGGICSILTDDIDLKERRVVLRLKGGREHVLYFGSPERRDGGRSVRALKHYIDTRTALVQRWAVSGDRAQGHLFLGFDGWPLSAAGFGVALRTLGKRAGIHHAHPHRFRHTFATWYLVRHPGDETGLRAILGHLSAELYRVYVHMAHEITAQRAGRVALSEAWLGDEAAVTSSAPLAFRSAGDGGGGSGEGYPHATAVPSPRRGRTPSH